MKYCILVAVSLLILQSAFAKPEPIFGLGHHDSGGSQPKKEGAIKRMLKGAAAGAAANLILDGKRKRSVDENRNAANNNFFLWNAYA
ncbi:unnamed protein product [Gongylonema pulchrum]|uniref:RxLR effector protein n=1 Tax=Gongylonema pulchrum TaxID=637853 RepID=A0A183E287_9BILA|nr:unnamed protein product [Gongylonema pulchrum]